MLTTIPQFVEACRDKLPDEIYQLFESHCTDELVARIYQIAEEIGCSAREPVRAAINHIGDMYNVRTMKDY